MKLDVSSLKLDNRGDYIYIDIDIDIDIDI